MSPARFAMRRTFDGGPPVRALAGGTPALPGAGGGRGAGSRLPDALAASLRAGRTAHPIHPTAPAHPARRMRATRWPMSRNAALIWSTFFAWKV